MGCNVIYQYKSLKWAPDVVLVLETVHLSERFIAVVVYASPAEQAKAGCGQTERLKDRIRGPCEGHNGSQPMFNPSGLQRTCDLKSPF